MDSLACMIPLKLKLRNFLSYGSEFQEVDFEPYNLICLSGKNGHGKSGLLDAITWAVWGQARKVFGVAKPDHGLLRLGHRSMAVVFDFLFNGCKYRIKREFTFAYDKPYSLLEFGLLDEEGDKFSALTDKTIRKTQEKIDSLLGLDYETFVNSAFLRQGSSNEFSKKSAKDRKEILGNILGLNKYEVLKKAALEECRKHASERDGIVKLQEHIQKDLDEAGQLKEQFVVVEKDLKDCASLEKDKQADLQQLVKKQEDLQKKDQKAEQLKFQLQKIKESYASNFEQLKNCRIEWQKQHAKYILYSKKDFAAEKDKIAALLKTFRDKQVRHVQLKEDCTKLTKQLQDVEVRLKLEWQKELGQKRFVVQKLSSEVLALKTRHKEFVDLYVSQSKETEELRAEMQKLDGTFVKLDLEQFEKLELWFDKAKSYYHSWVSQGNFVQNELKGLTEKIKTLSTDNPSCPLCEQVLTASRKRFLKTKLEKSAKFYQHRFDRISKLLKQLKQTLLDEHKNLQDLKTKSENNKLTEAKLTDKRKIFLKLTTALKEVDAKQVEINGKLKEFAALLKDKETDLSAWEKSEKDFVEKNKDFADLKTDLEDVEKRITDLNYSEQEHKKAEETFVTFAQAKEAGNVDGIVALKSQLAEQFFNWLKKLRLEKTEVFVLSKELKSFDGIKTEQEECAKNKVDLDKVITEVQTKKADLQKKETELKVKLDKLKELAVKQEDLSKKVKELDGTLEEYKAISIALGKDGIQALLIEESIPEIEEEANNLLARLTNNQSQIFIESLRDLKKGGTKETLDIKISDTAGIRPYEMFSGGEAFRIDFALRIAISKLLARRAGTALQTLIIDEGFGSQDEEGLSHIMDAIYKIQDDFSKVIVVSHLPSLKDQFPVHFVVEKGPAGSHINVLEQG